MVAECGARAANTHTQHAPACRIVGRSMSHCEACKGLLGQSGDVEPHRGMRSESQVFYRNGVLEAYTCRVCCMRWQRFVGQKSLGTESGSWNTLNRS
jgi:hypothetical protein